MQNNEIGNNSILTDINRKKIHHPNLSHKRPGYPESNPILINWMEKRLQLKIITRAKT